MTGNDVLDVLMERDAILKGHFVLSSGLHSDTYIQCAKLQEVPAVCERLCTLLLEKMSKELPGAQFDVVASPALGGVVFGYEVARQLGIKFVFVERVQGNFELRRGFVVEPGSRVLVVEDVITTGGSSIEVVDVIAKLGGKSAAELCIIDRGGGGSMPFPVVSLLQMDIKNYSEDELPAELRELPIVKPGSRRLT
ncbi:MAG: orotate phosphoribosyltransferase [Anaplasma sp.]